MQMTDEAGPGQGGSHEVKTIRCCVLREPIACGDGWYGTFQTPKGATDSSHSGLSYWRGQIAMNRDGAEGAVGGA